MLAASFEDDFAQFLVRGRIGSDPQLSMVPVDPQLGDWVEIRCQGLEAGQLCGADGQRWAVVEGSTVRCQVTGPMSWSLRSASGVPLCSLQVEPPVGVPRLLEWGLRIADWLRPGSTADSRARGTRSKRQPGLAAGGASDLE